MVDDALFTHIASLQGSAPWGSFLDAGTGRHSLLWVSMLETSRWTAVTTDGAQLESLKKEFRGRMRPQDRLLLGSWTDPRFLDREVFDTILADYLLAAVDCYSPHFQERLFGRLRPHAGGRFYVVGLAPYPESSPAAGGRLILEIARLRDACILLAGHRPNREVPMEWVLRSLEGAGFAVEVARAFPILYGPRFIHGQLDVCLEKLPFLSDRRLAREIERAVAALRERALSHCEKEGSILFGEDFVISAKAAGPG
ncbi:MAG: class I SAM-dependent methyltransferase [Planctomycetes bacterium]|nr:class I SAM-dependent methyltransferase [Planctomycetota bacterium]